MWATGNVVVHGLEKLTGQSLTLYSKKEGVKSIPIPEVEGGHAAAPTPGFSLTSSAVRSTRH